MVSEDPGKTQLELVQKLEELVERLGTEVLTKQASQVRIDQQKDLLDKLLREVHAPSTESVRRTELEIIELCSKYRNVLPLDGGKTLRLKTGTVKWRNIVVETVVTDEKSAIAFMRGRWRRYWRYYNCKLVFSVLKDALKRRPDIAKEVPGVELMQKENFYIHPTSLAKAVPVSGELKSLD